MCGDRAAVRGFSEDGVDDVAEHGDADAAAGPFGEEAFGRTSWVGKFVGFRWISTGRWTRTEIPDEPHHDP